ncbi:hypothetical protein RJ639_002339 [Escallonia herrerae]|uniref:Cupin type-1 domain-containing protein n=1 Tax=Escallonia herrerae TaxID=1293975 RepID=A0AA88X7K3_9ASTE|nr:hypothetical protein RJ639_002339 [Escallonia herrerae]
MAKTSVLSLILSIGFLVIFHGCFAQLGQQPLWQALEQQQQHRLRARSECRIERLTAQQPNRRYESEAGVSEFWDRNNEEFQCAGVEAVRNEIHPKGLMLPHYNNVPQLVYIIRGQCSSLRPRRGIQGTVIPGCAETYESDQLTREKQRPIDRHQKIRRFREGDILALPAGVALWFYNDGEESAVSVSLLDIGNEANQLDQQFRNFFLAGESRRGERSPGEREQEGRGQQGQEGGDQGKRGKQKEVSNIFSGFDEQILAEAFNIDPEIARRLQGQDDQRGRIVRAERFQVVSHQWEDQQQQEEEGQHGRLNGLEETLCQVKLRENIGNPTRADVFNPRGGLISTLNSHKLPILNWLQLSAERGVLYKNAVLAPHWNKNAHCVMYVTRGSGRVQIVGNSGRSVFDGEVSEGQLIVVPQNFAVVKKASQQGLEWVAFKTRDNAISSPLAGRLSAIRAMPEDVLVNSYGISREDARSLKYNREELKVFGPGSRSQREDA